jgi:hypothetical protein
MADKPQPKKFGFSKKDLAAALKKTAAEQAKGDTAATPVETAGKAEPDVDERQTVPDAPVPATASAEATAKPVAAAVEAGGCKCSVM